MHFVRKEAGRYYLHPIDRDYAFGRIRKGEISDRNETETLRYTQFALLHRGAEYFKQTRLPREQWKTIEAAAKVLLEIDYNYLDLWGYYQLVIDLYERLQDKTTNLKINGRLLLGLGHVYRRMGYYEKANNYLQRALDNSRLAKDRWGEEMALGDLGILYYVLEQYTSANDYFKQALIIARGINDRRSEGIWLGSLGACYCVFGQTLQAVEYTKQALAIAREMRDQRRETVLLDQLASSYVCLGQIEHATYDIHQALTISRTIGFREREAWQLNLLAEMHIDGGRYDSALQHATASLTIAAEIGISRFSSNGNITLALAHLYSGDLPAALQAALVARQYDEPRNIHFVFSQLGVIALRQGYHTTAQEAFTTAIAKANSIFELNNQDYFEAWDTKGLAYSGLALCESSEHVPKAIEAYQAARALCKDVGIVNRVLRLCDALAVADEKGILAEVRKAAAGEK